MENKYYQCLNCKPAVVEICIDLDYYLERGLSVQCHHCKGTDWELIREEWSDTPSITKDASLVIRNPKNFYRRDEDDDSA